MIPCARAVDHPGWSVSVSATVCREVGASPASSAVAAMFGLPDQQSETLYDHFALEIKPGMIVLVTGPSGAGKSVLLREVARRVQGVCRLDEGLLAACASPAVDVLAGGSLASRLAVLSRCGLAEATALVTPARRLSGGQRARLALAAALHEAGLSGQPRLVIADEFCSLLDLQTVRSVCRRMRKLVAGSHVALLAATSRSEIAADLRPDKIVLKPLGEPPRMVDAPTAGRKDEVRRWPIVSGRLSDYRRLAGFHYRRKPPACHKRVYVIRRPEGVRRPRWQDVACADTAAAMVISPPLMNVRGRNLATGDRYAGRDRRAAIARLNREMECIARVVVHPTYRGRGLAERLVRHGLATAQTPMVEALGAMARVHPFLERAGMTPTHLEPDAVSRRLLDAARAVGLSKADVAAVEPVRRVLTGKPALKVGPRPRARAVAEFRRVVDRCLSKLRGTRSARPDEDELADLCRRTARQYVYYLWRAEQ